jgi:RNA polymerase sigma-32 factor
MMGTHSRARLLSEAEERTLIERWTADRDPAALSTLAEAQLPLVLKIAKRYRTDMMSLSDLTQEGYVGLMEAAHRFSAEHEVRFATYAQWWIKSSIQEFAARNAAAVRVVTSSRQRQVLGALRRRMKDQDAGELLPEEKKEMAQQFGVSTDAVGRLSLRVNAHDTSLDATAGPESGTTLKDLLVDEAPNPEAVAASQEEQRHRRDWLAGALSELPERERRIIHQRHLTENKRLLRSLGDELGVSKERVRQLEQRAMSMLQKSAMEEERVGRS